MSGVSLQLPERVMSAVAFEAVERLDARYNERGRIGLAEYTEEWHVAASGTIAGNTDFPQAEVTLEFSMDFFEAPEQRRSDLLTPTFHFGSYQLTASNPAMVVLTAAVRSWTIREDGAFIGAVVALGVFCPNATTTTTFSLVAHLSFSGWGAPFDSETGSEGDVTD